jgi:hypothetical protein
METAKVDIRKLQILNDCINRTIEALNQVRLSVHGGGLGHSAQMGLQGVGTPAYFGNYPGAFTSPFGFAQQATGMVPGFANLAALTGGFPNAFGQNAFAQNVGLGHTAFDPRVGFDPSVAWNQTGAWNFQNDPFTQARWAQQQQTFPFVQWGQSPFGWPNV